MEYHQQRSSYPSPLNSPSSYGSSSTGINPVQTPKAITRSDPSSPYPTTFVQADTTSFKQVVQMLTGSPGTPNQPPPKSASTNSSFTFSKSSIPPIRNPQKKQPSSKLYERRNQLRNNNLMINTLVSGAGKNNNSLSPRHHQEILSPSMLDFPRLVLSPVTPLMEDIFNNANKSSTTPSTANSNTSEEEDKAIAEKGFYFHPSPRTSTTPKGAEPQLLSLFPVTGTS
ncbi:hypothetical protein QQ045_024171 [Rhodiola kirilowii]